MPTHRENRSPRTPTVPTPRVRALALIAIPLLAGCVQILGDYRESGCSEIDCSRWAKRFGDAAQQGAAGVVVLPDDDLVVLTNAEGTIDLGRGPIKTSGVSDMLVTRFDPGGAEEWTQVLSGPGADYGSSIALDPKGNVLIAGSFEGTVTFAGQTLVSAGDHDAFVAKLSPEGHLLWARTFGDAQSQTANGVASDGQSSVLLTGCFAGDLKVGAMTASSPMSTDVFVIKLGEGGEPEWLFTTGSDGAVDCGARIRADANDDVLVAGNFQGTVTFEQPHTALGGDDIFLAKLGSNGAPIWSRRYGGVGQDLVTGLTITPPGYVVLAGAYQTTVDFGTGAPLTAEGGYDPFVASIQGDGTSAWALGFGGADDALPASVTFDEAGDLLVAGYAGILLNESDPFVANISSEGVPQWSQIWRSPGSQEALSVAVDHAGDTVLTGRFTGDLTLSGRTLKSAGGFDVLLAKLGPAAVKPEE